MLLYDNILILIIPKLTKFKFNRMEYITI